LIDFWSKGSKYQNLMFWIVVSIAFVVFAIFTPRHLGHVFG
jgi:succinate dehydrogenase / fumarate reductase cytochrome b subunit